MIQGILIAIVMLVIVALILSAANDYREGKIRIRFDDDECDHKDSELMVFDESDNLRTICARCGLRLK